jgi:hypothetical protein
MKLLLTADLHFRTDWFRWLMEQAPSYDLVCIAWLDRGSTMRRQTGMPWTVLHHVPPQSGPGVSGEKSEGEVTTDYTDFGDSFRERSRAGT